MSSTITTLTRLARIPVGASTTSTAFLAPEICERLVGFILLSTSATTSSTRPPLFPFRCSIASRASDRLSATIASARVPRAAEMAASKPASILMCEATKPLIPLRPAELSSVVPSFCSRVRFRALRLARSESLSRSAVCSSSLRVSIFAATAVTSF